MSSEIDQTRQRTVAELLAEHGEGTGRRRRRREAAAEPGPVAGDGPAVPGGATSTGPWPRTAAGAPEQRSPEQRAAEQRSPERRPAPPRETPGRPAHVPDLPPGLPPGPPLGPPRTGPVRGGPSAPPPPAVALLRPRPPVEPVPDRPVDRNRPLPAAFPSEPDPDTHPLDQVRPTPPPAAPPFVARPPSARPPVRQPPGRDGSGPGRPGAVQPGRDLPGRDGPGRDLPGRDGPNRDMPGAVPPGRDAPGRDAPGRDGPGRDGPGRGGAAALGDRTVRVAAAPADTGRAAPDVSDDDLGPPTMLAGPPAAAEPWQRTRAPWPDPAGGPLTEAAAPLDFDDHPAGLDDDVLTRGDRADPHADHDDDDLDEVGRPADAPEDGAGSTSPGRAWAVVVAQWIGGAIAGAALWVGFRFLWRELPVVALAAAVLVTVGLVLVVRALLRNNDLRTTVVAVLVGLLLTVSPAILVLMDR